MLYTKILNYFLQKAVQTIQRKFQLLVKKMLAFKAPNEIHNYAGL